MPTSLIHPNPNIQQAMRALSRTNTPMVTVKAQPPWGGYLPDLDPSQVGANVCASMYNLVPGGAAGGSGEVLEVPPGFEELDTANLPLGGGDHILLLGWFPRTDVSGDRSGEFQPTIMAIEAGDGGTPGTGRLFRLQPSTAAWQEIAHSDLAASVALSGDYPGDTAETHLYDWAVMPNGASPRTDLSPGTDGVNPDITEPAFVFTNLLDPVMVYPVDPGAGSSEHGDYEILTAAFGAGASAFRARSVEAWGDRLNYLNTIEDGVHYRQRLRRTGLGTADPDPAVDGSGSLDFRDFTEDGYRVEGLGNLLACYFGDGVAVVRRSGNPVAPYEVQTLTTKRGLLSTHSLANLGDGTHLGIFSDGWFFLNSSGQFTEAGLAEVGGVPTSKWKHTFLNRLDMDLRERIYLFYDQINRWVWLTLPMDGAPENQETWIYEPHGDRVFPTSIPATVFGAVNQQLEAGVLIGGLPAESGDGTIGGLTGTIGSFGAKYGTKAIIHGTNNGLVMMHNPNLSTQVNIGSRQAEEAAYLYKTVLSSAGSPRTLKTAHRLLMEHVKTSGGDPTFRVFGNAGLSEQGVVSLAAGSDGDVVTVSQHFRTSSRQLGFEVSGRGPIQIRNFELDAYDYGVEPKV
jgi:hypothetical protein